MSVAAPEVPAAAGPATGAGADWRRDSRNAAPPDLLTGFRFPPGYLVSPEDHGNVVSREEFWELRDAASWKIERADGKIVVMPRSGRPHRRAAYAVRVSLSEYWMSHRGIVRDVEPERWVLFGDATDRFPDAAVLLIDSPLAGDHLDPERVPDVLFEFVSPGRDARDRDYTEKRAEYHALGVREYVIVDPDERRVTVLRWEPDGYAEAAVLDPAGAYTSPLLPGPSVPLADALAGDE